MIHYALACAAGHSFDGWFRDSGDYERQVGASLVSCPTCGSTRVEKALMAPRLARSSRRTTGERGSEEAAPAVESGEAASALMSIREAELRAKLAELKRHLVANSEHVGARFPEEARKMHYGETEQRSIHGEASAEDAAALREEGIEVHALPILPDERN